MNILWENAIPQVNRITKRICARYPWVDCADLANEVLSRFPTLIRRYKPERKTNFNKFLYFTISNMTRDILRKEDPLGIRNPIRKAYPSWHRLSEMRRQEHRFGGGRNRYYGVDAIVSEGIDRIDRGYEFSRETE